MSRCFIFFTSFPSAQGSALYRRTCQIASGALNGILPGPIERAQLLCVVSWILAIRVLYELAHHRG